jgi:hypothetical protein
MKLEDINEAAQAAKNLSKLFGNQAKIAKLADWVVANLDAINGLEAQTKQAHADLASVRLELERDRAARKEAEQASKLHWQEVEQAVAAKAENKKAAEEEYVALVNKGHAEAAEIVKAAQTRDSAALEEIAKLRKEVNEEVEAKRAELARIEAAIAEARSKLGV